MSWRHTTAKHEAALRRCHDNMLAWSAVAIERGGDEIIAEIRACLSSAANAKHVQLFDWRNDEEYALERHPFETFRNGLRSAGE